VFVQGHLSSLQGHDEKVEKFITTYSMRTMGTFVTQHLANFW